MSDQPIAWGSELTPDELAARMKAHPFADVREPLMTKLVLLALAKALPQTPVRTGHLRRSETFRVEAGGLRGFIGSNVIYAPFVHKIVPFLQMGIDDSRAEREQLIEAEGDKYFKSLI